MNLMEVNKAKELRGQIISRLYEYYGEDISLNVLKSVLRMSLFGTDITKEIKKAIYYLGGAGKEYVKLVLNEDDYMNSLIWLTPKGVNLAEGDIEDIGVMRYE
ncbi:MAG: hypothetical protein IJ079_03825 [Lachnospiraceae bacterium]|nr:hypothetical protein [Lachnospiraceae bacterium]MBR1567537.1 hypothetical protein [Lachnospiraceae bacterium]MBR1568693.1 hypothetical protein [Lachnospiraceae bacterium]